MLKKDDTGKRWVEMELLVPGTPEQAWQAMATGPGYTAWFTRTEIEERAGGALRFQFGAEVISTGEVTVWEPPHRFSYVEREWNEGAPHITTDITITPRSGNHCLVRMVHWLVAESDAWDEQMEGFEVGWAGFFDVLRVYLTSFAGQKAASFGAMASVEGDQLSVWLRLTEKLGLAGASVDERHTLTGPEALSGTVERVHQDAHSRSILVRLHEPRQGVVLTGTYPAAGRTNASLGIYLYGETAADTAAASEPIWQNWFKETFPA